MYKEFSIKRSPFRSIPNDFSLTPAPLVFTDLQVSSPEPLLKSSFSEVEWEYVDFGFFWRYFENQPIVQKIHLEKIID